MPQFDELFEKYFSSNSWDSPRPFKKQKNYDDYFLGIIRNEENGTSFFENFIRPEKNQLENNVLDFSVTPFKTYIFNETPGVLNLD